MKILYFDTETTGLDPVKNDIIELAGIVEIDGEVKEEFCFKVRPFSMENVSPEALAVSGSTLEQIALYDDPREVYNKLGEIFLKYIDKFDPSDKFTPAGQNARFDVDFLRQFFIKNGDNYFGSWMNYRAVDLQSLVCFLHYAEMIDLSNHKLETIANYCGIEFNAHSAMDDIRTTRLVIKALTEKFIKPPEEKSDPIVRIRAIVTGISPNPSSRGGYFSYVFFKGTDDGKSYKTCLYPQYRNYKRWEKVLAWDGLEELIVDGLIVKMDDLIDADSFPRIVATNLPDDPGPEQTEEKAVPDPDKGRQVIESFRKAQAKKLLEVEQQVKDGNGTH